MFVHYITKKKVLIMEHERDEMQLLQVTSLLIFYRETKIFRHRFLKLFRMVF